MAKAVAAFITWSPCLSAGMLVLLLLLSGAVGETVSGATGRPVEGAAPGATDRGGMLNDAPAHAAALAATTTALPLSDKLGGVEEADDGADDGVDDEREDALASQADPYGVSGTMGTKERLEIVKKLLKQEPLIDG